MNIGTLEAMADTEDALGIEGIQLKRGDYCTYCYRTGDVGFERGVSVLHVNLSKFNLEERYFSREAFMKACEEMARTGGFSLSSRPSDDGHQLRIELM